MNSPTLLIQKYLETHSLNDLSKDHGVYASVDKINSYKASFNYDQIEAKDDNLITQEARGLILVRLNGNNIPISFSTNLDEIVGNTIILSFPFKRFFNHGQGACASVDWNDKELKIFDKKDGTLIIVYFDFVKKDWCVATRSVCEANLDNGSGMTFAEIFKRTLFVKLEHGSWKDSKEEIITNAIFKRWCECELMEECTYMFELCTPYNTVVVNYQEPDFYYLGSRSKITHVESNSERGFFNKNIKLSPILHKGPLTTNVLFEMVNSKSGKDFEGVVVCDSNFNRCKIKNAEYLAISKISQECSSSPRNMISIILSGKMDDALSIIPDFLQEKMIKMNEKVIEISKIHENFFSSFFVPGVSRKDFALLAQTRKDLFMGYLMESYVKEKSLSFVSWISSKRTKEGNYPLSIVDGILKMIGEI